MKPNGYFVFPILGNAGPFRDCAPCGFISIYCLPGLAFDDLWAFGINLTSLPR